MPTSDERREVAEAPPISCREAVRMHRTKAAFRAIREMVGMTQHALAQELGVEVRSVKRWESPDAPQMPPQDAWDVLDAALADQRQVVAYALGKVDEVAQQRGNYPHAVTLPYWTSQAAYDAGHVLEDGGDWRMANANSRLVAFALHERGIPVEWIGTSPVRRTEEGTTTHPDR